MARKIENIFEKSNLTPLGIRLLTFLARHPSEEFYLKELAKEVGASASGCFTALGGLLEDNLVVRRKDGVNVYWRAETDNPALVSFKVFMNIQELGGILKALKELALKVVLFGSCSRGDDTSASDIDLLVVTLRRDEIGGLLRQSTVNGRALRPIVMGPHDMVELTEKDPALSEEIAKGIVLMRGDMDE